MNEKLLRWIFFTLLVFLFPCPVIVPSAGGLMPLVFFIPQPQRDFNLNLFFVIVGLPHIAVYGLLFNWISKAAARHFDLNLALIAALVGLSLLPVYSPPSHGRGAQWNMVSLIKQLKSRREIALDKKEREQDIKVRTKIDKVFTSPNPVRRNSTVTFHANLPECRRVFISIFKPMQGAVDGGALQNEQFNSMKFHDGMFEGTWTATLPPGHYGYSITGRHDGTQFDGLGYFDIID
jgi:hypothetical protein